MCRTLHLSLIMVATQIVHNVAELMQAIDEGATSFLMTEYRYMLYFMVCYWLHY